MSVLSYWPGTTARDLIQLVERQLRAIGGLEILGGQRKAVLLGDLDGLFHGGLLVGQCGKLRFQFLVLAGLFQKFLQVLAHGFDLLFHSI